MLGANVAVKTMTTTKPTFLDIFEQDESRSENSDYLSRQLITYIGNKRSLAGHLERAVGEVRERLGGRTLRTLDLFSGSGFVARLMKQHSSFITANDLEPYSRVANECYLSNPSEKVLAQVSAIIEDLNARADQGEVRTGFIQEMYAPRNDGNIQLGERVFYSADNARRLDFFAQEIAEVDPVIRPLVLAPLLSSASVHANTSGVFKGFYKDKNTGIGKFGGAAGDALKRILDPIRLEMPVLSSFRADSQVFQEDANSLVRSVEPVDLVYVDPPYNQHPYGSNYFMLNLLVNYRRPEAVSEVSGIPVDWNRSGYNVRKQSMSLLQDLFDAAPARFVLVSFNAEGYIATEEIRAEMDKHGRVEEFVVPYNTFRGSRNLRERAIHVNEHLFLLDRQG